LLIEEHYLMPRGRVYAAEGRMSHLNIAASDLCTPVCTCR